MIDAGQLHALAAFALRIVLGGAVLVAAVVGLLLWRADRATASRAACRSS